jgi:hypothetical protein
MPDIDRIQHLRPSAYQHNVSRPDLDLVSKGDEETDDDCSLVDLNRKKDEGTSQGNSSPPSGESLHILPRSLGRPRENRKPSLY